MLAEGPAALFTLVWLLSLMNDLVLTERVASLEGLATFLAFVGFGFTVNDFVLSKA